MSLYSIAMSGVNASSLALSTTSKNITNVNTSGYSRQLTNLASNANGGGVKVTGVERQYNQYISNQLNQSNSTLAALNANQNQISQIDSLLGDTTSGLSVMMQNFFSALQDLSSTPADPAARQGVLGTADNMTAQFRSMNDYLNDLAKSVNSDVTSEVSQINTLTSGIADLNKQISLTKAKTGEVPNALMDQRDELVAQLSTHINISVDVQDTGTYNVSFANGLSLVAGFTSSNLEATASSANPTQTAVGYRDSANNLVELKDSTITGGALGGTLQFRNEGLSQAQNKLGQLGVSLAMAFNEQSAQGVDLNGDVGGDFFTVGTPKAFSNEKNAGTASFTGTFTDASQLTADNYSVTYSASTGYTVTNSTTGKTEGTFAPGTTSFDVGGMTFSVSGAPADGDKFIIKPFQDAISDMNTAITDVDKIAAGQATGSTGSGDNRNAAAFYDLQNSKVVNGGSTLNQAYASMVTDIGNQSQVVSVKIKTQQGISDQLTEVQQSTSGVNLDEEAIDLLKYQQSYQASAKIIDTATTLIDTILGIKG
ncbi:flagellar hook-associated protein FlgK [Pseudomonas putida]|uniref:Flagellar hook-associated protein 1 n=1 Tax=Pseudomonas putida TaxID=303 RepID=A0A8I1EB75_PSEPU|nr:flagellar hook-associated protein FlgK [Pseudomonas putida]MBI6882560.1 flagellar hook-associated protein FlgK [Pseudomonas putida]